MAAVASGKTLVAEILLLRRVTQQRRKAIVVVPFVSLAREKTLYLQVRPAPLPSPAVPGCVRAPREYSDL